MGGGVGRGGQRNSKEKDRDRKKVETGKPVKIGEGCIMKNVDNFEGEVSCHRNE